MILLIPLCLALLISSIHTLPQGAPSKVCDTMLPFHGGGIPVQTDPSPFIVSTIPQRDGTYQVVVSSPIGVKFGGFMLQARTGDRQIVGEFQVLDDRSHLLECSNPDDTATHTSPNAKESIELQWKPPTGFEGNVVFNATVAQDYATFWVGIQSASVSISKRHTVTNTDVSASLPPRRTTSTTVPSYVPETANKQTRDKDPFYAGCDVQKLCFGAPDGCVSSASCDVAVAITVRGSVYEFELKAKSEAAYAAVGLSDDGKMGDDGVLECVKEGSGINAYLSYTITTPSLGVQRPSRPQQGIQLLNSSLIDGSIYCKVQRDPVTTVNGVTYDLINNKYYLLVAAGSSASQNKVNFHDIAALPSASKNQLSDVSPIKGSSKVLVRLHGAFMIIAWIGTASVGILLARYFRQTWVGGSMCGKDMWFAWHRIFMVLTWLLTMAGFVIIFVEIQAWSSERNPHAILGTVTTVICFLQPIGAYFRPHPGTSKRPIFNWLHWLGGNVAQIVGIVTIFFSVKLNKAELPDWMDWILVAFVAFHVIMHLVLSVLGCISDNSSERRITSFPMKDLGGSGRTSHLDRNADAPKSGVRKFLLAIYLIVIILLVTALVLVVVLAPIENTVEELRKKLSESS